MRRGRVFVVAVALAFVVLVAGAGPVASASRSARSQGQRRAIWMAAVTPTRQGFVAVGSDRPATKQGVARVRPVVWTAGPKVDSWKRASPIPTSLAHAVELRSVVTTSHDTVIAAGIVYDARRGKSQEPGCCPSEPRFWRSTDGGKRFTAVRDDIAWDKEGRGNVAVVQVAAADDGTLLAAGRASSLDAGGGDRPVVWRSTDDGRSWDATYLPLGSADGDLGGVALDVSWGKTTGFVVAGAWSRTSGGVSDQSAAMWVSRDGGKSWDDRTLLPDSHTAAGIAVGDEGIAVVGFASPDEAGCSGTMWFTPDSGGTWTHTEPDAELALAGVRTAADGRFVAFGHKGSNCNGGAMAYTSSGSDSWQSLSGLPDDKFSEMLAMAPFGKTGQVLVGQREDRSYWWKGS